MYRFLILCSFAAFLAFAQLSFAEGSLDLGAAGPIHIDTDSMSIVHENNMSLFQGNVVVTRGELEVRSDELEVYLDGTENVERLVSKGNVRITKKEVRAVAETVELLVKEDKINLSGGVKVWRGEDSYLEGETVSINTKTGDVNVYRSEDRRVKIIFTPEEGGK
jgi:lipopolysaccharide export system protein LptA